jgi:hypothetical protein
LKGGGNLRKRLSVVAFFARHHECGYDSEHEAERRDTAKASIDVVVEW